MPDLIDLEGLAAAADRAEAEFTMLTLSPERAKRILHHISMIEKAVIGEGQELVPSEVAAAALHLKTEIPNLVLDGDTIEAADKVIKFVELQYSRSRPE